MTDATRSWLYLCLLVLATTLSSSVCQWWSIHPTFPIVGINLATSLCLFIFFGRNICILFIAIQCLFGIVCVTVGETLKVPLNISTIIHGTRYASHLGLSVFSHVPVIKSLFFVICAFVQIFFLFKITRLPYRKQVGIVAFASFVVAMGSSFAVQPLREFWPQDTVNGKISSTPPERRSLHARGYLATYALELGSGYPWRMQKQTQPMESPHGVENLPLLPCTDKIVLIQVEALDYEMLTEKAGGEYVMPFLHSLLDHAVLLRLDGTKKMASANSDYEVFTGRIASHSILHYEYEKDYSGSFLRFLTQKISPSYSFHGMPGNYMNQEVAYRRQGVQYVYGLEKMQAEGVPAVAIWTDGIAADTDLFGFAAKKIPVKGPFLHFIITLDMHVMDQPEMVCNSLQFADEPRSVYYSLCRHTDTALAAYIRQLPEGTTVAIWGDHRSYTSEASGYIPFLFFVTGQSHPCVHESSPPLNRSKMYHYLQRNFGQLFAQKIPATAKSGQ